VPVAGGAHAAMAPWDQPGADHAGMTEKPDNRPYSRGECQEARAMAEFPDIRAATAGECQETRGSQTPHSRRGSNRPVRSGGFDDPLVAAPHTRQVPFLAPASIEADKYWTRSRVASVPAISGWIG
jgi:hypothetical protein